MSALEVRIPVYSGAMLGIGVLLFILSLPLAFRKVPMNRVYGIRVPAAFQSQELWYKINAYGGRCLALASLVIAGLGAGMFFLPRDRSGVFWLCFVGGNLASGAVLFASAWRVACFSRALGDASIEKESCDGRLLYAEARKGLPRRLVILVASLSLALGILVLVLSLPLAFGWIPMNPYYGIRVAPAFQSPDHWHQLNVMIGWRFALWALLPILSGIVGLVARIRSVTVSAIYTICDVVLIGIALGIPIAQTVLLAEKLGGSMP